jgi:hypothetical protein
MESLFEKEKAGLCPAKCGSRKFQGRNGNLLEKIRVKTAKRVY